MDKIDSLPQAVMVPVGEVDDPAAVMGDFLEGGNQGLGRSKKFKRKNIGLALAVAEEKSENEPEK